jgi:hypothetical protein
MCYSRVVVVHGSKAQEIKLFSTISNHSLNKKYWPRGIDLDQKSDHQEKGCCDDQPKDRKKYIDPSSHTVVHLGELQPICVIGTVPSPYFACVSRF